MSTKIYVVKYIKDPRRWEPRNVGLIVARGSEHASKFLGEQSDGKIYKTPVKNLVNDTDLYVDWVNYFKDELTKSNNGIDGILVNSDSSYVVMEAGEVWQGETDPVALIDEYFPKLVRAEASAESDEEALEPRVERLLGDAGVAESGHLQRDALVSSAIENRDGKPVPYQFHYYWEHGHKIVGERLSLKRPDWTRGQLWKFEHLEADITRVAFVTERIRQPDLEAELDKAGINEAIDVDETGALKRIVRIFNAG